MATLTDAFAGDSFFSGIKFRPPQMRDWATFGRYLEDQIMDRTARLAAASGLDPDSAGYRAILESGQREASRCSPMSVTGLRRLTSSPDAVFMICKTLSDGEFTEDHWNEAGDQMQEVVAALFESGNGHRAPGSGEDDEANPTQTGGKSAGTVPKPTG